MYRYDEFDAAFVAERTHQFQDQIARRLNGSLSEEEFRPIRLRNGVYLQLHAYMLRIAIPYGTMNSTQLRALADIGRRFDKGYGHFTTRQNIQFNWVKLNEIPQILAALAKVQMHAIQTSGNCIRNVTADHFAGVAADEIADPRPIAEIIRQWSSGHPEFEYLPRKFKIAVTGAVLDRAAIRSNDIGIALIAKNDELGACIYAGGGLGRTPIIGSLIKEFVPIKNLLNYLEAILRVYNAEGRRDNKYKARIKILLSETGLEEFSENVEREYAIIKNKDAALPNEEIARIHSYFALPPLSSIENASEILGKQMQLQPEFATFVKNNSFSHKHPDYLAISISLKPHGGIPGDLDSDKMDIVADLAEKYSQGEIRVSHFQNLVLPHIAKNQVFEIYKELKEAGLATNNIGQITDIIACPGLDYCTLATARSIPIAQNLSKIFGNQETRENIGPLSINISGCINACGHHHIGNIGILGLEKAGRENYQITLGGDATLDTKIGERLGRGVYANEVPEVISLLIDNYLQNRKNGETFTDSVNRLGIGHFREKFNQKFGAIDADN